MLEAVQITNSPLALAEVMTRAGEHPEVVLEGDLRLVLGGRHPAAEGGRVMHLAHPLGVKAFEYRRVKNDLRDAADLADLLRMGRLPEAWIAPPATRELRELVRHRAKLVAMRSNCKAQVHAVLAKCGVMVAMSDLFGVAGTELLDGWSCPAAYAARIASLRRVMDLLDFEIDVFAGLATGRLARDPGYVAVQTIPGIGPILGAVLVAEIGDMPASRPGEADLLGRDDPPAPRVRHHGPPRPDHQTGLPAGPLGRGGVRPTPARHHQAGRVPGPGRRPARPQHRAWSPPPAASSSTSSTPCATTTSRADSSAPTDGAPTAAARLVTPTSLVDAWSCES